MNRVLEEWDYYQTSQKKQLLKKFIDFDANQDGVLSLEEFKELMRSLEGPAVQLDRVVTLFKETVDASNELEQQRIIANGGVDEGNGFSVIDKIEPECFVETVTKHRVGGFGHEFLDFEFLYQNLQKPIGDTIN